MHAEPVEAPFDELRAHVGSSGRKLRVGAVVAQPDQLGCALTQRLGHLPAAPSSEFAYGCKKQAFAKKQRYHGNRLQQTVDDVRDPGIAGAKTGAYRTRATLSQPRSKIDNGVVG